MKKELLLCVNISVVKKSHKKLKKTSCPFLSPGDSFVDLLLCGMLAESSCWAELKYNAVIAVDDDTSKTSYPLLSDRQVMCYVWRNRYFVAHTKLSPCYRSKQFDSH